MEEYEVILDFSGDAASEEELVRLIQAISEGKKFKTKMSYFGDGNYNAFFTNELSMVFNTNTLINLADEMGFEQRYEEMSPEEKEAFIKDLNENGYEDNFKIYLEESKDDFIE